MELKDINKSFGATKALQDVSMEIVTGEIHAILGENGAGKSTLIKILSGVYPKDSGEIYFCGDHYMPESVVKARSLGISTAFQELSLLPNLTVAENLFLPHIQKNALGLISKKKANQTAKAILHQFDLDEITPLQKVAQISLAQKQRLETVRAMVYDPKLLILDEATAALFDPEWLFKQIDGFVRDKGLTVLFITHRLKEARRFADRLTILKNGFKVTTKHFEEVSDEEIFKSMTGRSANGQLQHRSNAKDRGKAEAILVVKNLCSDKKTLKNEGISFSLTKGEILGVAGLEGQGQRELFESLGGVKPIMSGNVEVEGHSVSIKNPYDAVKSGLILLPEERKTDGIFPGIKTTHNISMPVLSQIKNWLGLVNRGREIARIDIAADKVQLDKNYYNRPIDALSGGNQQKAIIARTLLIDSPCLIFFDPTRGVDVGTKQNIYRVMRDFANSGKAILFYSTEISEIVELCERCAVFYNNEIITLLDNEELSEAVILEAMLGYSGKQGGITHGGA